MKFKSIISSVASTLIVFGVVLLPFSADAKKPFLTVNCDAGQSLQVAIDSAKFYEPLEIKVLGTCEENVSIRRDDVIINGNNNATVIGELDIQGSRRILVSNITLTGPGYGIHAIRSEITLSNVTATQNDNWAAIITTESGALNIQKSNIVNNPGTGVYVGLSSSLVSGGNTVISNNQDNGVQVELSSSALLWYGTSIQGNGHGVAAGLHSSVLLENANVSNNTYHGIDISRDAGVLLRGENTISDNGASGVFCHDFESSFVNVGAPITDTVNCTNFN